MNCNSFIRNRWIGITVFVVTETLCFYLGYRYVKILNAVVGVNESVTAFLSILRCLFRAASVLILIKPMFIKPKKTDYIVSLVFLGVAEIMYGVMYLLELGGYDPEGLADLLNAIAFLYCIGAVFLGFGIAIGGVFLKKRVISLTSLAVYFIMIKGIDYSNHILGFWRHEVATDVLILVLLYLSFAWLNMLPKDNSHNVYYRIPPVDKRE